MPLIAVCFKMTDEEELGRSRIVEHLTQLTGHQRNMSVESLVRLLDRHCMMYSGDTRHVLRQLPSGWKNSGMETVKLDDAIRLIETWSPSIDNEEDAKRFMGRRLILYFSKNP